MLCVSVEGFVRFHQILNVYYINHVIIKNRFTSYSYMAIQP